jgi:hypothetical protein
MSYATITIEGGFFPSDLLDRIASNPQDVPGQSPKDFGLPGKRLTDEIQSLFSDAQSYWTAFRRRYERAKSGRNQSLTTVTREGWLDPLLGGFGYKLNFQRMASEAGGDSFGISHREGDDPTAPPVHIIAYDEDLDSRRAGRRSPHATVQEYLNRSDVLWGIVTNGRSLRLLRNSARLSKPTYLEFDLEGMIEGNVYSEFVLFYRLLHRTRLPHSAADGSDCILEKYYQDGIEQGGRVRERLRDGVEAALKMLGNAFIAYPRSQALRAALADGTLKASEYYRELLRLVYRMLFLMVAEERKLLFPDSHEHKERRAVFLEHYGIGNLRFRAERRSFSDSEIDIWEGLKGTFRILREDRIARRLGMAALNGELFGPHGCPHIEDAYCKNDSLLTAIDSLSRFDDEGTRRRVNFGALDVEELGSVYESLLEFHPDISANSHGFDLIAGSERKTTGSYYTPPELVHELIESALVPVMQERLAAANSNDQKQTALLRMRVVDPAAGSGHFLLAAARRIGKELARLRTDEEEPAPSKFRHAVRDVIRHCIYAVDKNPLAVDLCKVALWIEGHNAGQPLSFLDAHVKCGDSLVGVFDLKALKEGIPDDAYKPVGDDDKAAAREYKRRNRVVRDNPLPLDLPVGPPPEIVQAFDRLAERDEVSPEDVKEKADIYDKTRSQGTSWWRLKNACDLWTAAFFAELKLPEYRGKEMVPTTETVWEYWRHPNAIYGPLLARANQFGSEHPFFHWPLEFADVFSAGGFDVVLGNPPWEQMQLDPREFFAHRAPEVANAQHMAARNRAIAQLKQLMPALFSEFSTAVRANEKQQSFIHSSGRFPLTSYGRLNSAPLFAELARPLTNPEGRAGLVLPSGIATDSFNQFFFRELMESGSLASFCEFENEGFFAAGRGHSVRFALMVMAGKAHPTFSPNFLFQGKRLEELRDPDRHFVLTIDDLKLINPNTTTCPIFRTRRDAQISKSVYRRVPILLNEAEGDNGNSWTFRFLLMFMMNTASESFHTRDDLKRRGFQLKGNLFVKGGETLLPLYEAKMINQFDHRYGDHALIPSGGRVHVLPHVPPSRYEDPDYQPLPRYWVDAGEVDQRLAGVWDRKWLLGWRDVTDSRASARTVISTVVPRTGVGHNLPILIPVQRYAHLCACLIANFSSFVLDYLARQKIAGLHLTFGYMSQLPVIPPKTFSERHDWLARPITAWIDPRVLELTYTAWDLAPFARDLGYDGSPFRWDVERRFLIRCELDAAFFHLYGLARDDVDFILDSFPIVQHRDEARFDEYRTKRVILEIFDEMERAKQTRVPYQTRLDPPPGDPRAAHPQSETKPITKDSPLSTE